MSFTTIQAAEALCLDPASLRSYRSRKGYGFPDENGIIQWEIDELETLRRAQAKRWNLIQFEVKFAVSQLEGDPINGTMIVWAKYKEAAEGKAMAWFWHALLKEAPKQWGTPVSFDITSITEVRRRLPETTEDSSIIKFS